MGYVLSTTSKLQGRLEQENRELKVELATMTSPDRLEALARQTIGSDAAGERSGHGIAMRRTFKRNQRRLLIAKVFFLVVFLVSRRTRDSIASAARRSTHAPRPTPASEGMDRAAQARCVIDRAGETLALSLESQSVYARPHRIQNVDKLAENWLRILNLRVAEMKQKLTAAKPFVWIKRQIYISRSGKNSSPQHRRHRHVLRAQSPLSTGSAWLDR